MLTIRKSGLFLTATVGVIAAVLEVAALAETSYSAALAGNQQKPSVSLSSEGGFVVWQDDRIDGRGWGVALKRIGPNLKPTAELAAVVNAQKAYNQEAPRVACYQDGSAIVVWQGGRRGEQDIYFRKISASGSWLTDEAYVNTFRNGNQFQPDVVTLENGDAIVGWTSVNQDGAYRGVFGRRIVSSGGSPEPFRVSAPEGREDSSPRFASIKGEGFAACWLSGSKRYWRKQGTTSASMGDRTVLARLFNGVGQPITEEIDVSPSGGRVAACKVVGDSDGFVVAWIDQREFRAFFRRFGFSGNALGEPVALSEPQTAFGEIDLVSVDRELLFAWTGAGATRGNSRVEWSQFEKSSGVLNPPQQISADSSEVLREIDPALATNVKGNVLGLWSSYRFGSGFNISGTQLR